VPGAVAEEVVTVLSPITPLAANGTGSYSSLIFLVLMVVLFYLLLIRPQQRRARQQRELLSNVDVGDEVVTIGGMHGTVREVDDGEVVLEIADGVDVRFLKSAIARRLVFDETDDAEEAGEDRPAEEEAGDQT
jgi:preprotein translocase subunit YajC